MRKRLICTLVVLGLIGQVQGAIVFLNVEGATPGEPIFITTDESLKIEIICESFEPFWDGLIMIKDGGVGRLTAPRDPDIISIWPIQPAAKQWPVIFGLDVGIPDPIPVPFAVIATTFFSDEEGEATISLYEIDPSFSTPMTLMDQLHVVVPEPATMLLLAAGGLLVRRKRA